MRLILVFTLFALFTQAQNVISDWSLKYSWLSRTRFFGCSIDSKGNCIFGGGSIRSGKGVDTKTSSFVRKYNSWGQLLWADSSTLASGVGPAGLAIDRFDNVYQTAYLDDTGGIYWGGQYYGPFCLYLLKYNPDGKLLWVKPVGGTMAENLLISNDDLFILGQGYLSKLDLDGNKYFTIGTLAFNISIDKLGRICLSDKLCDEDGKVIKSYGNYCRNRICDPDGNTYCYYNDSLSKFDPDDNMIWSRTVPKMSVDEFRSTIHLEDNKLYIASEISDSSNKYFKVRSFTTSGDFRWQYDYPLPNYASDVSMAARNIASFKGHILVSGWYGDFGNKQALALKLREPDAELMGVKEEQTTSLLEIFPNPGKRFIIKGDLSQCSNYKVTNASGKLIISEKLENCAEALQIDMSRQPQGVYLLSISGKKSTQHHKLLVE